VCTPFLQSLIQSVMATILGFITFEPFNCLVTSAEAFEPGHLGDGVQHHDRDFAFSLLLVISVGRPVL
jgi:hypothetical protein